MSPHGTTKAGVLGVGMPQVSTLARLLMQMVMVKQIGNMGAIISRNMAVSLRMSAKSLGKGSEVRSQRLETFTIKASPSLSPSSSPPLLGITVQFAPVGEERLVCNLDSRGKHILWAVQALLRPQ